MFLVCFVFLQLIVSVLCYFVLEGYGVGVGVRTMGVSVK